MPRGWRLSVLDDAIRTVMSASPAWLREKVLGRLSGTIGGVDHDWRPYEYLHLNRPHMSWRCTWCHAVACGDYGEDDPCWLPYHHAEPHRSRDGATWPLGGDRHA